MDTEFGITNEILDCLKCTGCANEYYYMSNTQRLKFLNEILKTLGEYAEYDINEED